MKTEKMGEPPLPGASQYSLTVLLRENVSQGYRGARVIVELNPEGVEPTPELEALVEAFKAELEEIVSLIMRKKPDSEYYVDKERKGTGEPLR